MSMKQSFLPTDILLPQGVDFSKWSVVACDQFTSQPAYWEQVRALAEGAASTYHIIFPEIDLEKEGFDQRIERIGNSMRDYLADGLFRTVPGTFVYIERTLPGGRVRPGLIGAVDLEQYDYRPGAQCPVRATEKTVLERIPPRVKIRKDACIESPHIMLLCDDPEKQIIEPLAARKESFEKLYDFELMLGGGHLAGYALPACEGPALLDVLEALGDDDAFCRRYGLAPGRHGCLQYAVGDGNHSLASAKKIYEDLKENTGDAALSHPARYALVELVNLHSDALEFEAIHRVVFETDAERLLSELERYFAPQGLGEGSGGAQHFTVVTGRGEQAYSIENPALNLTVASIQAFLDEYLAAHPGRIDYVHGADVTRTLGSEPGNIGFLLPAMEKEQLFPTVILDGALPRKTFSMGEACEKRYYLECRKLTV